MKTSWTPNIDRSLENFASVRDFVKMSATWSSVGKKSTSITWSWMSFLMKCMCSSMCLLRWCWTGSLASLMALWLSHQSLVGCWCWNPNSERICRRWLAGQRRHTRRIRLAGQRRHTHRIRLAGQEIFIKFNISSKNNFITMWLKNSITFDIFRISKKNTLLTFKM